MYNRFPSGHSATAFSLFFMLTLALKGKKAGMPLLFFGLAAYAGYSRIYLGLHFTQDVLAGSAIGVLITFLCYRLLNNRIAKRSWSERGLLKKGV